MKTKVLLFLIIIMARPVMAQQELTLEQCYEMAKARHPLGLQKDEMDEISTINKQINASAWHPQLMLNAQASYQSEVIEINLPVPGFDFDGPSQDQYRLALDVNQTIWDGGSTRYKQQLNDVSHQAELQQLEVEMYSIHDQVNRYFFQHFLLLENQTAISISLEEIRERLGTIQSAVQNGVRLPSVGWALEVEILKLEQSYDELQSLSAANLEALSILLGKTVNPENLVLPQFETVPLKELNRPELSLFSLQKQNLEAASQLASSARMPRVSAFAQGGYGKPGLNMLNNEFDFYYVAGLRLTWNIWDWNKTQRQQQINTLKSNMLDNRREAFEQNIQLASAQLSQQINRLQATLTKDLEIIELQERIAATASSEMDNGTITSTDYLAQINALTRARITYQTHKIQLSQYITQFNTLYGNQPF